MQSPKSGKWTAGKRMLSFETGRKEACQGSGADICVREGEKVEEISSL